MIASKLNNSDDSIVLSSHCFAPTNVNNSTAFYDMYDDWHTEYHENFMVLQLFSANDNDRGFIYASFYVPTFWLIISLDESLLSSLFLALIIILASFIIFFRENTYKYSMILEFGFQIEKALKVILL